MQEAQSQLAQASGQPMLGEAGKQCQTPAEGTGQSSNNHGETAQQGQGASGHHEDSGSSAPYGQEGERLASEGESITIPRKEMPNGMTTSIQEATPGQSRVPYRDIYSAYRQEAEATLSREPLPPALRTYVRTYFASLEP